MPAKPAPAERLRIDGLGAGGDGLARWADGGPAFVPDTLPGEDVLARRGTRRGAGYAAEVLRIVSASADRQTPPCPHFGACGGCALQHAGPTTEADFKRDLLRQALRRAGVTLEPEAVVTVPAAGTRRRLDLALRRQGPRLLVGLHGRGEVGRGEGGIVDLTTCVIAHPTLVALLPGLRAALAGLDGLRREGSAVLNLLDTGVDLLLRSDAALSLSDRTKLVAFARQAGLPRLSWALGTGLPETVAQLAPVTLSFGTATVSVPPGAFLQASEPGEAAIRRAVLAGLPDKLPARARLVELFAGLGTLSFALAERGRVDAYEGEATAEEALRRAAGGQRIATYRRDLARQPLQPAELRGAAAVVLDPPFAGAAAQMVPLAASRVPTLIYVSCNPAALSRDLKPLLDAGYRVERVTPVDQFRWSTQLESVIVLRA
jgi:23S rRNA (uracil1939-C5)-methyltransferase